MPLGHLTADLLEEEIKSGLWPDKLPGYRALCEGYQVSRKTMTSALQILTRRDVILPPEGNRSRRINPQLNNSASDRSIKGRTSVLFLCSKLYLLEGAQTRDMIDGLQHFFQKLHWQIHHENTPEILDKPGPKLKRISKQYKDCRWLVFNPSRKTINWCHDQQIRIICAGGSYNSSPVPYVGVKMVNILEQAVKHLVQSGHRRITALIDAKSYQLKYDLETILGSYGIQFLANYHLPEVHALNTEQLNRRFENLFSITPPTAVILHTQEQLICFYSFCIKRGLRIPEDVSVIVAEKLAELQWFLPQLTHFEFPIQLGIKQLAKYIEHYPSTRQNQKFLAPKLVLAQSTRRLTAM